MSLRKRLLKGAKLAAPIVVAAREGEEGRRPDHGYLATAAGDPAATEHLHGLLGRPEGTPTGAALTVVAPGEDIEPIAPLLRERRAAERRSLIVLIGDPASRARRERALTRDHRVEVSQILHLNALDEEGEAAVMDAAALALGDLAPAAARANPALRPAVAHRIVSQSSRRAGLVGALPLAGADMPALAYLQIRMVARLAVVYDRPITPERALDALAIVGAGFGWRALGRAAVSAVPVAGWAAGGAVAFAGTRVVGETARARLSSTHNLIDAGALERVRPQFERLVARLSRG
ncbi:MAG: DUF697 domain-containing protein [Thermoleophilia bacterium]